MAASRAWASFPEPVHVGEPVAAPGGGEVFDLDRGDSGGGEHDVVDVESGERQGTDHPVHAGGAAQFVADLFLDGAGEPREQRPVGGGEDVVEHRGAEEGVAAEAEVAKVRLAAQGEGGAGQQDEPDSRAFEQEPRVRPEQLPASPGALDCSRKVYLVAAETGCDFTSG